jgi:hypothetical protein
MTLPDERYRSLVQTKEFLKDIGNPNLTPRVPKIIRQQAIGLLRHWPDDYHLDLMCKNMPGAFAKELEPLYRMIKQHEQDKQNEQ